MQAFQETFNRTLDTMWVAFLPLRILFIILDIAVFGVLLYSLKRAFEVRVKFYSRWEPKKRTITLRQAVFKERWNSIVKKFSAGSPESLRISIIEADALVDEALKQVGLSGQTMADRLTQLSQDEYPSLRRIWKAHRLRNDIVHQPGFSFTQDEGTMALQDFESFLKELQALD